LTILTVVGNFQFSAPDRRISIDDDDNDNAELDSETPACCKSLNPVANP
jgi:hypothetical protein